MPKSSVVPYVPYEASEKKAAAFLRKYHPLGDVPVPIEEIFELELGMALDLHEGLYATHGLNAALQDGLKGMWVDGETWEKKPFKLRFTLAQKIGHLVLHKDFFEGLSYESPLELARQLGKLTQTEIDSLEIQACNFAEQILVPKRRLMALISPHMYKLFKAGIDLTDKKNTEKARAHIGNAIHREFEVSKIVVAKRLEYLKVL